MTLKEGIEKHLEGKTLDPKIKLEDICEFVTDKAREKLDNESGAIDSDTVFSWVDSFITTDYVKYYADKEKEEQEQKEREEKKNKNKPAPVKKADTPSPVDKPIPVAPPIKLTPPKQFSDNPLVKGVQLSLFGGDLDDSK